MADLTTKKYVDPTGRLIQYQINKGVKSITLTGEGVADYTLEEDKYGNVTIGVPSGGSGGDVVWDGVGEKPFSTIGTGLISDYDVLQVRSIATSVDDAVAKNIVRASVSDPSALKLTDNESCLFRGTTAFTNSIIGVSLVSTGYMTCFSSTTYYGMLSTYSEGIARVYAVRYESGAWQYSEITFDSSIYKVKDIESSHPRIEIANNDGMVSVNYVAAVHLGNGIRVDDSGANIDFSLYLNSIDNSITREYDGAGGWNLQVAPAARDAIIAQAKEEILADVARSITNTDGNLEITEVGGVFTINLKGEPA